ncbi:uncharacterized protein LOC127655912 isoform X2 [Xyrauchen texanus]|uniref:uncharacterized protein LOC127655912 isoform X2 n=1 Tax=Xyrauchen texanus TaxID=154827 RepID=UPI0022420C38|nr:uncharacterized protein LOC127655912 isoform X2 [Xyrauchen texanus]
MDVAVREAGLAPHVRCFAHTLNLASQAGLSVPRVSRLLGRVRRIAAFFHRSSTATAALAAKKILLELPAHKLVIDVTTCWNSSLGMIEHYLEQQAAVTATLLSNDVRRNVRDIDTLDGSDIHDAEDMDEGKEGASGHPPAAEQPLDQTDRAGAELKQPPSKKTALEDLLGGTFDEPVAQHFSQIDAEMNKCRAETSISLNSCAALQSLSSVRIVVSKTYYSAIKNMSFVWSSALGKDVCNVHINHI